MYVCIYLSQHVCMYVCMYVPRYVCLNIYIYSTPMDPHIWQDDQLGHTYSSYVRLRNVALNTCQRRWTIGRSGKRRSGISVPAARRDDIYIYIYIYIYIKSNSLSLYIYIYICQNKKVHEEICIFLIHSFCSYIRVIYMYVSSLLLSSETICAIRPC